MSCRPFSGRRASPAPRRGIARIRRPPPPGAPPSRLWRAAHRVAILTRHAIDEINRRFIIIFRGALNFLAVLICPGQKQHIESAHLFVARDSIRCDSRVRVPEVRARVYVVNWSGDVILRFCGRHFFYFDLSLLDTELLKRFHASPFAG